MSTFFAERFLRRVLIAAALSGVVLGLVVWGIGRGELANWIWAAGTGPVVVGIFISMIRDLLAGRMGVDCNRLRLDVQRACPRGESGGDR